MDIQPCCVICGKEMKIITNTHLQKHGISMAEYSVAYPDSPMWSDSTRRLLSQNSPMKNNEIAKAKVADALRGKAKTPEHRANLAIATKKHWAALPESEKAAFRNKLKGRTSWLKGKSLPLETRRKLSLKCKGRKLTKETIRKITESCKRFRETEEGQLVIKEWARKMVLRNTGRKASEETKNKIRQKAMGRLPSPKSGRGKASYYTNRHGVTYYLRSSYELAFAKHLDRIGLEWKYEIQRYYLPHLSASFWPDFFIYVNGELDHIIELKNYIKGNMQKEDAFRELYPEIPLVVLDKKAMQVYGVYV